MFRWSKQSPRVGRGNPDLEVMNGWAERRRRREQDANENALLFWILLAILAATLLIGS